MYKIRIGSVFSASKLKFFHGKQQNHEHNNPLGSQATSLQQSGRCKDLPAEPLTELGIGNLDKLPFSIKVLLESCAAQHGQLRRHRKGREGHWLPGMRRK